MIRSNLSEHIESLNALPNILKQMNNELNPTVSFNVFAGDEFQGLLAISQNIFEYIDFLEYKLFPSKNYA